jgi:hypothetical protein
MNYASLFEDRETWKDWSNFNEEEVIDQLFLEISGPENLSLFNERSVSILRQNEHNLRLLIAIFSHACSFGVDYINLAKKGHIDTRNNVTHAACSIASKLLKRGITTKILLSLQNMFPKSRLLHGFVERQTGAARRVVRAVMMVEALLLIAKSRYSCNEKRDSHLPEFECNWLEFLQSLTNITCNEAAFFGMSLPVDELKICGLELHDTTAAILLGSRFSSIFSLLFLQVMQLHLSAGKMACAGGLHLSLVVPRPSYFYEKDLANALLEKHSLLNPSKELDLQQISYQITESNQIWKQREGDNGSSAISPFDVIEFGMAVLLSLQQARYQAALSARAFCLDRQQGSIIDLESSVIKAADKMSILQASLVDTDLPNKCASTNVYVIAPYHGRGDTFADAAAAGKYQSRDFDSLSISLSKSADALLSIIKVLETTSHFFSADTVEGHIEQGNSQDVLQAIHEELSLSFDGPGFTDTVRDLCAEVTEQSNDVSQRSQNSTDSFVQFDGQGDALAPLSGDIIISAAFQSQSQRGGVNSSSLEWLPVVPQNSNLSFPVRSYTVRSLSKHMQIVHEATTFAASDLSLGLIANTIAARTAFCLRPLESPLIDLIGIENDQSLNSEVDSVCKVVARALVFFPDESSDIIQKSIDSDSNFTFGSIWLGPLRHVLRSSSLTFPLQLRNFSALFEALCSSCSSASAVGRFVGSLSTIAVLHTNLDGQGHIPEHISSALAHTITLEDEHFVQSCFLEELRGTPLEEQLWIRRAGRGFAERMEDFAINIDGYREGALERRRVLVERRLPLQLNDIQKAFVDNPHIPSIFLGKDGPIFDARFDNDVFSDGLSLRNDEPSYFLEIKQSSRKENSLYIIVTPDEGGRIKSFSGWALLVRRIVRAARDVQTESNLYMQEFLDAAGVESNKHIHVIDKTRTSRARSNWNKSREKYLEELSAASRLLSAALCHCVNLPGLIAQGLRDSSGKAISISSILDQLSRSCLELLNNCLFPLVACAQQQLVSDTTGQVTYLCGGIMRSAQSVMSLLATLSTSYPVVVYRPFVLTPNDNFMDMDTEVENNNFPVLLPISIAANFSISAGGRFFLPIMRILQSVLHSAQFHANTPLLSNLLTHGREIAQKAIAAGLGYETNKDIQNCLGACLILQSRGLKLLSTLLACGTGSTPSLQPKQLARHLLSQDNPSDSRLLHHVIQAALQIPLAAASQKALQLFKEADEKRLDERKATASLINEKKKLADEAEQACIQIRLPLNLSTHVLGENGGTTRYICDADLSLAEQVTLSALLILQSLFLTIVEGPLDEPAFSSARLDPSSYMSIQKTNALLTFSLPEGSDKLYLGRSSRVAIGTQLSSSSESLSRRVTAREAASYLPPMLLNPVLALLSLVGYDSALVYPMQEHQIPDNLRYVAAVHHPLSVNQRVHIAPASIDTTALSVFTLFTRCLTARRFTEDAAAGAFIKVDVGDVLFSDLRSLNFSKSSSNFQLLNRKGVRELLLGNALPKGASIPKATRVHDAVLLGTLRLSRLLFDHEKVLHVLLNRDDLLEGSSASQADFVNSENHHPSVLDASLEILLLKQDLNYALGPKLLCEALAFLLQLWHRAASGSASAVILRETQRVRTMEPVWKKITEIALQSPLENVEIAGQSLTFDEKDLLEISKSVFLDEPLPEAKSIVSITRASYAIRASGLAFQLLTFELSSSQSRNHGVAKGIVESKVNAKIFSDLFEKFNESYEVKETTTPGDSLLRFVINSCTRVNFAPVSSLNFTMRKLAERIDISLEKYKTPLLIGAEVNNDLSTPRYLRSKSGLSGLYGSSVSGRDDFTGIMNDDSLQEGSEPIQFLNSVLLRDASAQPVFGRNFSFSVDHLASDLNMSSLWLRMQSPFITQLASGEKRGILFDIKQRLARSKVTGIGSLNHTTDPFFADQSQIDHFYERGACLWAVALHNTYSSLVASQLTRLRGAMSLFVTVILGPLLEKQRLTASVVPVETRVALINCAAIAWSRLSKGLALASTRFGFGQDSSADAATIEACYSLAQVASVFLNGAISLGSHEKIAKYSRMQSPGSTINNEDILVQKAQLFCLEVVVEGLQCSPIRTSAFQSGSVLSKFLAQQAMRLTALQVTAATRLCPRTQTELSMSRDQRFLVPFTLSRDKLELLAKIAIEAMKDALEGIQNNLSTSDVKSQQSTMAWTATEAGTLESASLHFSSGIELLVRILHLNPSAFSPSVDRSVVKELTTPLRKSSRLSRPFSHLMAAEELAASSESVDFDMNNQTFLSHPRATPIIEALFLARSTFETATKTIAALISQHQQNWLRFLISHASSSEQVSRSTHDQRDLFFNAIGLGSPSSYNMGIGGPSDSLSMFSLAVSLRASLSPSETSTLRGLSRLIRSSLFLANEVASGGGNDCKGALLVAQLGFADVIANNSLFLYMNSVLSERIISSADIWGGVDSERGSKLISRNIPPSPVAFPSTVEGMSALSVTDYLFSRGLVPSRQAALLLTFAACGHGLTPSSPIRGYGRSGYQRCELHLAWCDALSLCTVLVKATSSQSIYSSLDAVITLGGVKDVCAKFAEGAAGKIALHTALGGIAAFPAFSIASTHEASCAALFLAALADTSVIKTQLSASSIRGRVDEENAILLEGTLSRLRESPYSHWKREMGHDKQSLCEAAPLLSAYSLRDACSAYKLQPSSRAASTDDYFVRISQDFISQVAETAPVLSISGVSRETIIEQFVKSRPGIHRLRFLPVSDSELSVASLHRKFSRASPSGCIWPCAAISSLRHLLASVMALSAAFQRNLPNIFFTEKSIPDSIDFHGATVVRAWIQRNRLQADVLSPQDQLQIDVVLESEKSSPFARSDVLCQFTRRHVQQYGEEMSEDEVISANLPLPGPEDLCLAIHAAAQSTFFSLDDSEQFYTSYSSGVLPTYPSPSRHVVESIEEEGSLSDEGNARLTFAVLGVPPESGAEVKSLLRDALFLLTVSVDRNFQACAYLSRNERDIIDVQASRSLFSSVVASLGDGRLLQATLLRMLDVEKNYKGEDEREKFDNFQRFGTMRSPTQMPSTSRGVSAGSGGDVPSNNQRSSVYAVFRDSRATLDDVLKMYKEVYSSHHGTDDSIYNKSSSLTHLLATILNGSDSNLKSSDPLCLDRLVSHLLTKILFIYFMHERQAISGGRYQDDESNVGLNLLELAFGRDVKLCSLSNDNQCLDFEERINRARMEDKNSGLDPITYSLGLLSSSNGNDAVQAVGRVRIIPISSYQQGGGMESLD